MSISNKVLDIYQKYYLCPNCLGRMWALLGTNTTNLERGNALLLSMTLDNHKKLLSGNESVSQEGIMNLKILAEQANFVPAQKVLENEGIKVSQSSFNPICHLCQNIFENLSNFINKAKSISKDIEFKDFLVGSSPDSEIINTEDNFKGEFTLLESESFKSHFNREIGKVLITEFNKPANFDEPDLVFIYNLKYNDFSIDLIIKPLFILGKYNKLIRGIPQTRWICTKCQGKGCELCNSTGKKYENSVEEFISPELIRAFEAIDSKFHGAGREDIDVKMLGTGRPFIIELKHPKKRDSIINLKNLEDKINQMNEGKVKITDLEFSNKTKVINLKKEAENTHKIYKAIVESEKEFDHNLFMEKLEKLKNRFENKVISQRTPLRVSHRRSDKIRTKTIHMIEGEYIKPNLFEFTIETQGGTYIKELIHGDEGRTSPSFAEIFECTLTCKELNVIAIKL